MKKLIIAIAFFTAVAFFCNAKDYIIAALGAIADVVVSDDEWPGVRRAAGDLCADVHRVSGLTPALKSNVDESRRHVIIGTIR